MGRNKYDVRSQMKNTKILQEPSYAFQWTPRVELPWIPIDGKSIPIELHAILMDSHR